MNKHCIECDKQTVHSVITKDEIFQCKGKHYTIPTQYYVCNDCGFTFTDETLPDPLEELYKRVGLR